VPNLKFGIEYDGIYYHEENKISDTKKEKYITTAGVRLLRIKETREKSAKCYCNNNVIYCNKYLTDNRLNEVIKACFNYINKNITEDSYVIDIDVKRDRTKIYELFIKDQKEKSLFVMYPEIAKQWHPNKNLSIKPDMVKPKSNKKFWWICEKGHEWQTIVNGRTRGEGCPFCAGKQVGTDNSLQALNPKLAEQWHPTKNDDLTPNDVMPNTKKSLVVVR